MKKTIYKKYIKILVCFLEFLIKVYDKDTWRHIKRIKQYTEIIVLDLGCPEKVISEILLTSSLHDIGKILIPKKILNKKGRLTEKEFIKMKRHTYYGERILFYLGFGKIPRNIALFHHEHYNGKGYPLELEGEVIPIEARIIALVDVYDALRQKRCYKESFSHEEAIEIIKNKAENQFDKKIVEIFLKNEDIFNDIFNKQE